MSDLHSSAPGHWHFTYFKNTQPYNIPILRNTMAAVYFSSLLFPFVLFLPFSSRQSEHFTDFIHIGSSYAAKQFRFGREIVLVSV